MSNVFAVEEAGISGDLDGRLKEERRFHQLQIHFGLRALAYYTSSGAWPTINLPDEIIIHIFSYLDSLQIMKNRLINRSFRNFVYSAKMSPLLPKLIKLPDDIIIHIFSHLDSLQIMKTRLVNHSFRSMVYSAKMAPLLPKLKMAFCSSDAGSSATYRRGPETSYDHNKSTVTVSNVELGTRMPVKGFSCLTVSTYVDGLGHQLKDLETKQVASLRYLAQDLGDSVVELSISDLRCSKIMTCQDFIEVFKLFTSVTKMTLIARAKSRLVMPIIVASFRNITHLDLQIEREVDEDGEGTDRFVSFEELPSTLKELRFDFDSFGGQYNDVSDCVSAMKGISKLANLKRLDLGGLLIYHDDHDDRGTRKALKKFYVTFAKMLSSLVNLEDLRCFNSPGFHGWHHATSWLQSNHQAMKATRLKTMTVLIELSVPVSAYKKLAKACNLLFPAMEELTIDYDDCDLIYEDESFETELQRMARGFVELQKHASLSKITLTSISESDFGNESDRATMVSNLEASLGRKIKMIAKT